MKLDIRKNELAIYIKRMNDTGKQTVGVLVIFDHNMNPLFSCLTLERAWKNNEPNVSCIPLGEFHCVLEYSPAFDKLLWEIYGVDGRTECKFHKANYWNQLNGCIGLGKQLLHIGSDNELDLTRSSDTMDLFHETLRPMNGKIVKLIIE